MASDTSPLDPEDVRIGATIAALRDAYGLSQAELARAIKISGPLMSRIESGQRHAGVDRCRRIASVLNVKLAAITINGYAQIADAS